MKTITIAVVKGGTGKTTTAAALAQAAVKAGKKVLVIDLDPQANLSVITGADPTAPGAFQLFAGTPAAQLIQHTEQGIDAITASPDLATIRTTPGSAKRLQEALEPISSNYDFAFIDTAPFLGELTYNAMQASTGLVIPVEADTSGLQGLYTITDVARQMQRSNPALSIIGAVITRFDGRPKLHRYLEGVISERGAEAGAPLLMTIRAGVSIREAQAMSKSLYDYAPHSKPAQDYKQLFQLIMKEL